MTALIISYRSYIKQKCKAIFQVYGYEVTTANPDENILAYADIIIVDTYYSAGWNKSICDNLYYTVLAIISADRKIERELPEGAIFYLSPVDIEIMIEQLMELTETRRYVLPALHYKTKYRVLSSSQRIKKTPLNSKK